MARRVRDHSPNWNHRPVRRFQHMEELQLPDERKGYTAKQTIDTGESKLQKILVAQNKKNTTMSSSMDVLRDYHTKV